jgi:chloride channel 3/4/5
MWYDQFTSTDWVRDSIADAHRVKALRGRKDFWGKMYVLFDGAQGWILSALVGVLVAIVAYCVDVAETTIFDYKDGYCSRGWWVREKVCRDEAISNLHRQRIVTNFGIPALLPSRPVYRLALLV